MQNITLNTLKRSDVPSELLKTSSLRELFFWAILDWVIIGACWYLMLNTSPYLYPLWLIIVGGRLHALGVILHDLTHGPYRNRPWTWRVLEVLVGYPIGSTIDAMAYHHLRHHRNTLIENGDPYFNYNKKCSGWRRFTLTFKKGPLFVPFWIVRGIVGCFATFIPRLRTPYARIFLQDISRKDLSQNEEVITCAREDILMTIFHTLVFALALKWNSLFWLYYAALPVGGVFCIYRLLIEHTYDLVQDRSVYTMIECTSDHHMGWYGKVLFGPHKIGYHCMHHIHPKVGFNYLPALREWYLENSKHYQVRTDYKTVAQEA